MRTLIAALAIVALTASIAEAGGSDRRRRGASTPTALTLEDLDLVADQTNDFFDGNEASSAFSPSIPTGRGSYISFPGYEIPDNGDHFIALMCGTGHFAVGSPVCMNWSADGRHFYRKRSTLTNEYQHASWRAGGSSMFKFPDNSRWRGHLGHIFMISGTGNAPNRHLMLDRSGDHGKHWTRIVAWAFETGEAFTAIGGRCVFPSDGSMLCPYYWRDCATGSGATCAAEQRYTCSIARSTDWETSDVPTFTARYADIMRDDPDSGTARQFEECTLTLIDANGDGDTSDAEDYILAKGRVDGTVGDNPVECNIYQSVSDDNGATWSAPAVAHRGCEKPDTKQAADGSIFTVTRAYGSFADPPISNPARGQICVSRDPESALPSWRCAEFQKPTQGEYESAAIKTDCDGLGVHCIVHAQERNIATPPTYTSFTRIFDVAAGASATVHYSSTHSWRSATNNKYLSATGSNLAALNGATAAAWEFWYRPEIDQGGTNAIMCRSETNQRQFCISDVGGAGTLQILVYASRLDAGAVPRQWTAPAGLSPVGEWHHWNFTWSAASDIRVARDGVDVTSLGSYGANPNIASLSTPTGGTFYIGANSATNFLRDGRLDDVVIRASDCYSSRIGVGHWAAGVMTDPDDSACDPIMFWRADNSFATDSRYASFTFTEAGSGNASTFLTDVPNAGGPTTSIPHLSPGCGITPILGAGTTTTRTFYNVDGLTRSVRFVATASQAAGVPYDGVVIHLGGCGHTLDAQVTLSAGFRSANGGNHLHAYPLGLENTTCNGTSGCGGATVGWCQLTPNAAGAPGNDDRDLILFDRIATWTATAACVHMVSTGVDYNINPAGYSFDPFVPNIACLGDSNGAFACNNFAQLRRYIRKVFVGNYGRLAADAVTSPVAFYGQFGLNDSVVTIDHADWSPRFPTNAQLAANMGLGGDASVETFRWDGGTGPWTSGAVITGCTGAATMSDGGNPSINADGGVGGCCVRLGSGIDGGLPHTSCWDTQTNHTFYPLFFDNVWRFFGLWMSRGERGDGGIVP